MGFVRMLFDLVSANSATLVDAFYQVLQGNEEAATFLHHKVVEERLKPSLENWLQETFASPSRFDPVAFELRQKAIGEVHARIKYRSTSFKQRRSKFAANTRFNPQCTGLLAGQMAGYRPC
jgi:hypothetical protein